MPAGSESLSRFFDARLPVAAHPIPPSGRLVLDQPAATALTAKSRGCYTANGGLRPSPSEPSLFEFWDSIFSVDAPSYFWALKFFWDCPFLVGLGVRCCGPSKKAHERQNRFISSVLLRFERTGRGRLGLG